MDDMKFLEQREEIYFEELSSLELKDINGGIVAETAALLSLGLGIAYYLGYYNGH